MLYMHESPLIKPIDAFARNLFPNKCYQFEIFQYICHWKENICFIADKEIGG